MSQPPAPTIGLPGANASPEAVAWMDRLCGVVRDVQRDLFAGASSGGAGPDELKRALSRQLGAAAEGLAAGARRLGELGSSPVGGGDAAVTGLRGRFDSLRAVAVAGKEKMDALPNGSSEQAVGAVMGEAWPTVVAVNGSPFKDVELTQAMKDAGRSATCMMVSGWPR